MKRTLDPRIKMAMVLLAALYIVLELEVTLEIVLVIIYLVPFLLTGLYQYWFVFVVVFSTQLLGSIYLLPLIDSPFFIYIISFLTNGFRLLLPGVIAGVYALKTTTISQWIAAFKKWHFPNWLMIPIAVMARFFPAIREDYRQIRKAMAFRGIGSSYLDLVLRPVQTLEYLLIPLLMNATQIAEDLTISALTKGLSLPGRHSTIVKLKMNPLDWAYLVILFLPMLFSLGGYLS